MPTDLDRAAGERRRIYLVRHGSVSYFDPEGRPYTLDETPLDAAGRQQVEELARLIEDVPLDRVLSSDLPRSLDTAIGLARGRDLDVETRRGLREISPGRITEMPRAGLEELFLGALHGEIGRKDLFLGGESFGAFEERVLSAFLSLLEAADWRRLLLVAHGGTNRIILSHALGSGLSSFGRIEQDPACLNVLDVDRDGSFTVRLVNHTAYSPAKEGLHLTTMERIYRSLLAGAPPRDT